MLIMRALHHDEADLAPIALEAVRIHPIVVDMGLAGFPPIESTRGKCRSVAYGHHAFPLDTPGNLSGTVALG